MTRIVLLSTGGTIACTMNSDGALVPTVSGAQLLDSVAAFLPEHVEVRVREWEQLDSSAITPAHLDALIAQVHKILAEEGVDGIVITHGTDSLEETAFALDLFHSDERPVVLTGAQRAFDAPDSDGSGNLLEAIRLAADPLAHGEGVLIGFGGWSIPARGAAKRHTSELDAFYSLLPRELSRPAPLAWNADTALSSHRVDILAAWPGADGDLVRASSADGLVIEALGSGNMGPGMGEAITQKLQSQIPVIVSTRVPGGAVTLAYGGAGGGATIGAHGALGSGYLRPAQARIALLAALATGTEVSELI